MGRGHIIERSSVTMPKRPTFYTKHNVCGQTIAKKSLVTKSKSAITEQNPTTTTE